MINHPVIHDNLSNRGSLFDPPQRDCGRSFQRFYNIKWLVSGAMHKANALKRLKIWTHSTLHAHEQKNDISKIIKCMPLAWAH